MEYNKDKVDQTVLALLYLNSFRNEFGLSAWKNLDWGAMDRLFEKGYISDPKSRAKSIMLTEEGERLAQALFIELFGGKE